MLPQTVDRGHFTVSFVIKSMKIAHLDNPSLSALSARQTLTHPLHSFPSLPYASHFKRADYKARRMELKGTTTCFSFAWHRSRCSSLRQPSLERHDTVPRPQKKGELSHTGRHSCWRKRAHKRIFICTPIGRVRPWRAPDSFLLEGY